MRQPVDTVRGHRGVTRIGQFGRLAATLPAAALVVLAALLALAALPDRAAAAPVLETPAARELVCVAGSLDPECMALRANEASGEAFGLLKAGGLLLSGAAASAISASESIAPVPLPAAGWLLLAGLGGLGLFGRRRRGALPSLRRGTDDGIEPLAATLRGAAWDDTPPATVQAPAIIPGRRLRDRLRDLLLAGEGLTAFALDRISPDRPCGGAGMLWSATAERAPPMAAAVDRAPGVLPRAGRHGRIAVIRFSIFATRMQSWFATLAAHFAFACNVSSLVTPVLQPAPVAARVKSGQTRRNRFAAARRHVPARSVDGRCLIEGWQ